MAKATNTEPTTELRPAERAELPAQLYTRDSKPNPREADMRNAVENVGAWFRISEDTPKAAKATDTLLRRAAKLLNVKVSVKLPQTEPGNVYFRVVPADETESAEATTE